MAGVKGRSGGSRPGAGRKPTLSATAVSASTPLEVLESIMRDGDVPVSTRVMAANYAAPYRHQKLGEGGKKTERQAAAKVAGTGKFAADAPPLALVKR